MSLCHYAEYRCAECRDLFTVMLNVIKLSVILLNVIMLSVIMLSVVAPKHWLCRKISYKSKKLAGDKHFGSFCSGISDEEFCEMDTW